MSRQDGTPIPGTSGQLREHHDAVPSEPEHTLPRPVVVAAVVWTVVAVVTSTVLERRNGAATGNLREPADVLFLAFLLSPSAAGALTAVRRGPRSVAGLLLGSGALTWIGLLLHALAVDRARHDGSAPAALVWPALWTVPLGLGLLALVPARARRPAPRPRLEPLAVTALVALCLGLMLGPAPLSGVGPALGRIDNPAAVPALRQWAPVVVGAAQLFLVVYAAAGIVALALAHHRRAESLDRAGEPWSLLALVLVPSLATAAVVGAVTGWGSFESAWVVGVLLSVVMMLATTVVTLRGWRRERRSALTLQRVSEARELERERVRHDLHDGIGPALAGMGLQLEVLRDHLTPGEPAAAAAGRLARSLDETLLELRRIVDGMSPATLEDFGLGVALRRLGSSWESGTDARTQVQLDLDPGLPPLSHEVEVTLLRVCAEALSNAVRHGAPETCRVSLSWEAGAARLVVADDGTGIGDAPRARGHGLETMRARVAAVGGSLAVTTADGGRGTAVTAVVPVDVGDGRAR